MYMIIRLLVTALVVLVWAELLPGIAVDGYVSALWVAVALGLLNLLVKPILIILTLPITIVTLGLFLLIINAVIIFLADYFVPGFSVNGIGWAILFSLLLSLTQALLLKKQKTKK
ncbi:MAG: phage holin family protein [Bacteroidota bacterium]